MKKLDNVAVEVIHQYKTYTAALPQLNSMGYTGMVKETGEERPVNTADVSRFMRKRGVRKFAAPKPKRKVANRDNHAIMAKARAALAAKKQQPVATHSTGILGDVEEVVTSNLNPRLKAVLIQHLVQSNG